VAKQNATCAERAIQARIPNLFEKTSDTWPLESAGLPASPAIPLERVNVMPWNFATQAALHDLSLHCGERVLLSKFFDFANQWHEFFAHLGRLAEHLGD